jgi:hypothetical protein
MIWNELGVFGPDHAPRRTASHYLRFAALSPAPEPAPNVWRDESRQEESLG